MEQNPNEVNQTPPNYQQAPPNPNGGYQQFPPPPGGGYQQGFGGQIAHPKSSSISTCGILGLVCTFLISLVGLILNIVTLSMAAGAMRDIANNPGRYTDDSIRKIKSGRTCAIIGISIQGFVLLILILVLAANA